jgi:type VI protein secretion system component VasF
VSGIARQLEDLSQELDMLVFRLERAPSEDPEALLTERRRLRRELETVRDRLRDLAMAM